MATTQRLVRFVRRRRAGRFSVLAVLAAVAALAASTIPAGAATAGSTGSGTVHATATTYPDSEGVIVDGFGGLHVFTYGNTPARISQFTGAAYWLGWDIARGVALRAPNPSTCAAFGGYILDGWGGLHPFGINGAGAPAKPTDGPYWKGLDIARDVVLVPQDPRNPDSPPIGGFVLDGYGGLQYFTINPAFPKPTITGAPYWKGWDIARGVVLLTASGVSGGYKGGYVIDAFGGTHPFAVNGVMAPSLAPGTPYWLGWDIVRGAGAIPASQGGFVLDGFGGLHGFATQGNTPPAKSGLHNAPYWSGWNIARGMSVKNIGACS